MPGSFTMVSFGLSLLPTIGSQDTAADNAYRQAIGLSPEQYVQLKRVEMELKVCAESKCTFIENAGAVPAFGVR